MGKHKHKRPATLYICDRMACGKHCPNEMCSYTTDISHATNFKHCGNEAYVEKESTDPTIYLQADSTMTTKSLMNLHRSLIKMKKTGVVVLPKGINPAHDTSFPIGFN